MHVYIYIYIHIHNLASLSLCLCLCLCACGVVYVHVDAVAVAVVVVAAFSFKSVVFVVRFGMLGRLFAFVSGQGMFGLPPPPPPPPFPRLVGQTTFFAFSELFGGWSGGAGGVLGSRAPTGLQHGGWAWLLKGKAKAYRGGFLRELGCCCKPPAA